MKNLTKIRKSKTKNKLAQFKKISIFELQNSPKYMNFRVKV